MHSHSAHIGAHIAVASRDVLWRESAEFRGLVEGMTGIEPALSAWEAEVLPLNYIPVSRYAALRGALDNRVTGLVSITNQHERMPRTAHRGIRSP